MVIVVLMTRDSQMNERKKDRKGKWDTHSLTLTVSVQYLPDIPHSLASTQQSLKSVSMKGSCVNIVSEDQEVWRMEKFASSFACRLSRASTNHWHHRESR